MITTNGGLAVECINIAPDLAENIDENGATPYYHAEVAGMLAEAGKPLVSAPGGAIHSVMNGPDGEYDPTGPGLGHAEGAGPSPKAPVLTLPSPWMMHYTRHVLQWQACWQQLATWFRQARWTHDHLTTILTKSAS